MQPTESLGPTGKNQVRLGFAAKSGVPPFGPLIPPHNTFEYGQKFREFFLTKSKIVFFFF